jgi:hypothetical protein
MNNKIEEIIKMFKLIENVGFNNLQHYYCFNNSVDSNSDFSFSCRAKDTGDNTIYYFTKSEEEGIRISFYDYEDFYYNFLINEVCDVINDTNYFYFMDALRAFHRVHQEQKSEYEKFKELKKDISSTGCLTLTKSMIVEKK